MFMLDCRFTWLYKLAFRITLTHILLPNAGSKSADWLLHCFIQCDYFHILAI